MVQDRRLTESFLLMRSQGVHSPFTFGEEAMSCRGRMLPVPGTGILRAVAQSPKAIREILEMMFIVGLAQPGSCRLVIKLAYDCRRVVYEIEYLGCLYT
jgi:hypothetical protein